MPMERAAESLKTFSVDILSQVRQVTIQAVSPTAEELREVASKPSVNDTSFWNLMSLLDGLENLEVMLHVIQGFGEDLPAACRSSCEEAWGVFDAFLAKFGSDFDLADRTTRVLRHGITLFGTSALQVAPLVIARMTYGFDLTGFPSYLWIAGKIIGRFGNEEAQELRGAFQQIYERSTDKVAHLLHSKGPSEIPDGMGPSL